MAGASEIDKFQQSDMGLTGDEIQDIAVAWRANMDAVHIALLRNKAFAWDLFPNQHDAGCGAGPEISKSSCDAILSRECAATSELPVVGASPYREQALYYGLKKGNLAANTVAERLPDLAQDLANFLCVCQSLVASAFTLCHASWCDVAGAVLRCAVAAWRQARAGGLCLVRWPPPPPVSACILQWFYAPLLQA